MRSLSSLIPQNTVTDAGDSRDDKGNRNPAHCLPLVRNNVIDSYINMIFESVVLKLFLQFVASQTTKPFRFKSI